MNKFSYYKVEKEGKVVELHIHENRGDLSIGKVFPENNIGEVIYHENNMIELKNVDEFLDAGIEVGIFNCKPIPGAI